MPISLVGWRQEDQKFKGILGYTESSRPAWDACLKNKPTNMCVCYVIDVLPACLYAHYRCAWHLWRSGETAAFSGTGVVDCYESPCGC